MLVSTYRDGSDRTGLVIGEANARKYFRRRSPSIELQLDDLHIQCTLDPDFWQGHPEIHDPRLSEWLKFKVERGRAVSKPLELALVPMGTGRFALRPYTAQVYQAFGADVAMPPHSKSHFSVESELIEERSVA